MKQNILEECQTFLDEMYGDRWLEFAWDEQRSQTTSVYWATTVAPGDVIDRAYAIDACMQIIAKEKSMVARVMVTQWLARELGGPIDLMTGIAMRGYLEV